MSRRLTRPILHILLLLLLLPVSACTAQVDAASAWQPEDVRQLDPGGDAAAPALDILAVYARRTSDEVQFRIDLLDLALEGSYCLVLEVREQDQLQPLLVRISAAEMEYTLPQGHALVVPRVVRDPWIDSITVSFNRSLMAKQIGFSAATYSTCDAETIADAVPESALDGPAPAQAQALIVFTDVFPAVTPVQAFRRWDGAHTGPTGERHGLLHVLTAARAWGVPLVLADLKTPAGLAALDFVGGSATVRGMIREELLLLPQVAASSPLEPALQSSRDAGNQYDLPASLFSFAASGEVLASAGYQFADLPDASRLSRSASTVLIPLAQPGADLQVTEDGPSIQVRTALVADALLADPASLVVLGGSLPESSWGDSDMAGPAFAWLASHPWVHVLDEADLRGMPVSGAQQPRTVPALADPFLAELQAAPEDAVSDSAWRVHDLLAAPSTDAALLALKQNYFGQIGVLLAASAWAQHPAAQRSCDVDPDRDGRGECILADETWFALVETDGGRLTHLFYGEHQLIGPTAQFAVGLSDPSEWGRATGDAADPAQVMGAFIDAAQPYAEMQTEWEGETLVLRSADGTAERRFRLSADGLEFNLRSPAPTQTDLPLLVDPGYFYGAPADYRADSSPQSWTWGPADGMRARVWTDAAFQTEVFTSSLPFLGLPENPNLDYPAGHYLPFPFSMLRLQADGDLSVRISLP